MKNLKNLAEKIFRSKSNHLPGFQQDITVKCPGFAIARNSDFMEFAKIVACPLLLLAK